MGDYQKLKVVLDAAYAQSAEGKGAKIHANGKDFERQPILEISRMVGPGFTLGQAMKKAQESAGRIARGEYDEAAQELLGVIVYAAAAVVLVGELQKAARGKPVDPARQLYEAARYGSKDRPRVTDLPRGAEDGEVPR